MHTELTEKGEDTETYRQLLPVCVVPARLMKEDANAPTAVLHALRPLCALGEHALPTPTPTQTQTTTPTPTAMSQSRALLALTLAATMLTSSGCFLVAAGASAAVAAFGANGISETGRATENQGALRNLTGTRGDLEVTAELKRESDRLTAVEVIAKKNVVDDDRDFAKRVLEEMAK